MINKSQQRALEIVLSLRDARMQQAQAAMALAEADSKMSLVKAQAEARVIESVGGDEKALGSNQAARERTLALAIADDEDYQAALVDHKLAYFHKHEQVAVVRALEEELKVLLAFARETSQ